jgi:tRNA threonylcarbamoyladenosine biosynthesis protein TsaB
VNLLAIESATDAVAVAVTRGGAEVSVVAHEGGRRHAELLMPSIEEACRDAALAVTDIEVVAVDCGPGLFTGLRVGVATAKALAEALGVGVVPVSSLDVLAAAAIERLDVERDGAERAAAVVAVVDARRSEVFTATYRLGDLPAGRPLEPRDPASVREDQPAPVDPDALAERVGALAAECGPVVVVGDGAVRYHERFLLRPGVELGLADELRYPPPDTLARLAAVRLASGARPLPPAEVLPDYLREADARINWEQRSPRTSGALGGRG